jgi:elongation factor P
MPKASEIKRGDVVEINGQPYIVRQVEAKSPSSRGAQTLYKIRFNNATTGQKLDESYTGDIVLKIADFGRREVQYLYQDGDAYIFMDKEDFSQHALDLDTIEELTGYIDDALEGMYGLFIQGKLSSIELPSSVVQAVVDTPPAIKGSSATSRTKPAITTTGLELQVPEYLEPGEKIRINTETGKFMSRA